MILKHPTTGTKIVATYDYKLITKLKLEGYIDVTPPRTEAQKTQSNKYMTLGQLTRTIANLRMCLTLPGQPRIDPDSDRIHDIIEVLEYKVNQIRGGG